MNLFLILVSVSGVWLSILGSHTRDSPVDTSDIYWDTVQTCFGGTDLQEHKIQNHSTGISDLLQRRFFFFKCWHCFFFFFGKDLYLSQDLIYIIFLQVSQLSDLFRKLVRPFHLWNPHERIFACIPFLYIIVVGHQKNARVLTYFMLKIKSTGKKTFDGHMCIKHVFENGFPLLYISKINHVCPRTALTARQGV